MFQLQIFFSSNIKRQLSCDKRCYQEDKKRKAQKQFLSFLPDQAASVMITGITSNENSTFLDLVVKVCSITHNKQD